MHEIEHDRERRRYVLRVDGVTASALDYADNGDVVSMVRTFTNPQFRGSGLAAEVVAHAVDEIEREGVRRIRPACWYVDDWFSAHPEKAGLLAR